MRIPRLVVAVVVVVALLLPATVVAQRPQVRRGFWLVAGAGPGTTISDCDECALENRRDGSYTTIALGGTVGRNVLVGIEVNSWYLAEESGDQSLLGVLTVIQWYPWQAAGFHVRSGVGWGYARFGYRTEEEAGKADKLGIGLRFGAGWDLRVSRMISVSPFLGTHIAALGSMRVRDRPLTNLLSMSRQVGIGVTIH